MFGKRFNLFPLFGVQLRADASWLLWAFLIIWSLAAVLFPVRYPRMETGTWWAMGAICFAGYFISLLVHEASHILVARSFSLRARRISMTIWGGVLETDREPKSARTDVMIALAGPLGSLILAFGLYILYNVGDSGDMSAFWLGITGFLATINLVIAAFNLIPAFPLDGGRLLRALLWTWSRQIGYATSATAKVGRYISYFIIGLGLYNYFIGNSVLGPWFVAIGFLLRMMSERAYHQLATQQLLEGETVQRFAFPSVLTISPSLSIRELVHDYIYKYHYKIFPVVDEGELIGCITFEQVADIPIEEWSEHTVHEFAEECAQGSIISPDVDALQAYYQMTESGNSRMLVVKDGVLQGVVTLEHIEGFLDLRKELEDVDRPRRQRPQKKNSSRQPMKA